MASYEHSLFQRAQPELINLMKAEIQSRKKPRRRLGLPAVTPPSKQSPVNIAEGMAEDLAHSPFHKKTHSYPPLPSISQEVSGHGLAPTEKLTLARQHPPSHEKNQKIEVPALPSRKRPELDSTQHAVKTPRGVSVQFAAGSIAAFASHGDACRILNYQRKNQNSQEKAISFATQSDPLAAARAATAPKPRATPSSSKIVARQDKVSDHDAIQREIFQQARLDFEQRQRAALYYATAAKQQEEEHAMKRRYVVLRNHPSQSKQQMYMGQRQMGRQEARAARPIIENDELTRRKRLAAALYGSNSVSKTPSAKKEFRPEKESVSVCRMDVPNREPATSWRIDPVQETPATATPQSSSAAFEITQPMDTIIQQHGIAMCGFRPEMSDVLVMQHHQQVLHHQHLLQQQQLAQQLQFSPQQQQAILIAQMRQQMMIHQHQQQE